MCFFAQISKTKCCLVIHKKIEHLTSEGGLPRDHISCNCGGINKFVIFKQTIIDLNVVFVLQIFNLSVVR